MTLDEYQELAARTLGRDRTHEQQLANAALGLTGEAGEVAEVIKKHLFHATPLDQDALAKELGPEIAINCICPGVIQTELGNSLTRSRGAEMVKGIALGRLGTPADVAQLVAFLATVEPNFMSGQDFKIDGYQWVT